ncbi:MAG: hypothetical protein JWP44_4509 [Mucilaginibacter sp.]|nr:hypothetical protein [Mucilaginibacter sp.]
MAAGMSDDNALDISTADQAALLAEQPPSVPTHDMPWRKVVSIFTYEQCPDSPLPVETLVERLECGHFNEVWPVPPRPGTKRRCWQCAYNWPNSWPKTQPIGNS